MTPRRKALLSSGAFAGAVLLTIGTALHAARALHDTAVVGVEQTARSLSLAQSVSAAATGMANAQQGVLAALCSKDAVRAEAHRQAFRDEGGRLAGALRELRSFEEGDRRREAVAKVEAGAAAWMESYADFERLAENNDAAGAALVYFERVEPEDRAVAQATQELTLLEQGDLERLGRALDSDYAGGRFWIWLGALGSAGTGLLALGFLRNFARQARAVTDDMLRGVGEVFTASGRVAAANHSVAQCTREQAATIQEASASATEITAIARRCEEDSRSVAELMIATSGLVTEANRNLAEMVQSMHSIRASSEKISKIIRVIDELAFQTNILALNAAVEAARAGEAGMGFAVVADEVRRLAHRSAQAASDTAGLIEECMARTDDGSRKLDQVGRSIHQVTAASARVKDLLDQIQNGGREQTRGVEQIATAMSELDKATGQSASNAQESAAAGEALAAEGRDLQATAERLRWIFAGEQKPVHAEPARAAPDPARTVEPALVRTRQAFPLDENEVLAGDLGERS